MKSFAVFVAIAAASLAGCAGAQPSNVPPLQQSPTLRHTEPAPAKEARAASWMAPGAKSGNLLYVTNAATNNVTVYSYPQGKLVGTLSGFERPWGTCTDKAGNVYITDYSAGTIVEFAHAGTKPLRTIKDSVYLPQGCSIDPATGNLAVANYETAWDYPGNLAVFRKAKGYPNFFEAEDLYYYYYAAYDGSGNAYVDGQFGSYGEGFQFAQLAKKSTILKTLLLPAEIGSPGSIVWDGTHLAIGDLSSLNVYEFSIANGKVTLANTTALSGATQVVGFTIDGPTLIAANQGNSGSSVLFYNYPAGGSPTLTLTDGVDYPRDVVVSHVGSR